MLKLHCLRDVAQNSSECWGALSSSKQRVTKVLDLLDLLEVAVAEAAVAAGGAEAVGRAVGGPRPMALSVFLVV